VLVWSHVHACLHVCCAGLTAMSMNGMSWYCTCYTCAACTAAVPYLRDLAHQLIFGQQHRQLLKVGVSIVCRGAPEQGL
jgi:hypothetical protein